MSPNIEHLELDIGDPRNHWVEQAHKLADGLGLPEAFIGESRYIVEGALTTDWLEMLFSKPYTRSMLAPHPPNHLKTLFEVAGRNQVVELMELAIYLKRLAHVKNIQNVVDVLREHYATALLQLAYAYRFQRAGCTELELEPETDRGKSDVYFKHSGRAYLVECYVPAIGKKADSLANLQKCAEPILGDSAKCEERLRISVRLKQSVSEKQAKQLGWEFGRRIRALKLPFILKTENETAICEVRPICEQDDASDLVPPIGHNDLTQHPDAIIDGYAIPLADVEAVRLGREPRREPGDRLVLWLPAHEREKLSENEYIEALFRRIGDKFRQAKRMNDAPGRVVISQLDWFASDVERSHRIGRQLQQRLIPRHENVAAIFLVERSWSSNNRYKFSGLLIGGRNNTTIPRELFDAINNDEQTRDVLDDWQ